MSVAMLIAIVSLYSCSEDDPITQPQLPTVTTTEITGVATSGATSGGNITSDGNATITARGVCWSLTDTPTIDDTKTTDGTGTGEFTSSIAGLEPGTTYYVRAYATNQAGTSYGSALQLTTMTTPASMTTFLQWYAFNSASISGNITTDGGNAITERGLAYSTNVNPTLSDNLVIDGETGTGLFGGLIEGLAMNTTYHVRAYATNSTGTVYGQDIEFTTPDYAEDGDGNHYGLVEIDGQVWMATNLKTASYKMGEEIPVTDAVVYNNEPTNVDTYGRLYSWDAATQGACPMGTHLPSEAEWTTLFENVFGGAAFAGSKFKEAGNDHWIDGTSTDEYGFGALPGGIYAGEYSSISQSGYYWMATESGTGASYALFGTGDGVAINPNAQKSWGMSVRCVAD